MTLREKKSKNKAKAIRYLVESGEYSPAYGLIEAEKLNDAQLILDVDFEPLSDWLNELLEQLMAEPDEPGVPVEEE